VQLLHLILMIMGAASLQAASSAGADFLVQEIPARPAGMAGAYAASGQDAGAFLWNPASLGRQRQSQVSATYFNGLVDTSYQQAVLAVPFKPWFAGALGLAVGYNSTRGLREIDDAGADRGGIENDDMVLQAGYGIGLGERLFLGAAGKLFTSHLAGYTSRGQALDLGVQSQVIDNVAMGISVLHWGSQSGYDGSPDPLPSVMKLGCQAQLVDRAETQVQMVAEVDRPWNLSEALQARLGAEYWYQRTLAFRAGYLFGADAGNLTIGLGARFMGVGLDYAYVPFNDLGFTNRLSLSLEPSVVAKALGVAEPAPKLAKPAPDAPTLPTPQRTPLSARSETTRINGLMFSSLRWTRESSPIVVEGLVTIPRGLTLTIEAGCEVRFKRGTSAPLAPAAPEAPHQEGGGGLLVLGCLQVLGQAEISTTLKGDEGPGWGAIVFETGSSNECRIEFAKVEDGRVVVNGASPLIDHCQFTATSLELGSQASPEVRFTQLKDSEAGLSVWSDSASLAGIHHNLFTRNRYGIYIKNFGGGALRQNTFIGNLSFDILNASSKEVDARNNFWGTQDFEAVKARVYDGRSNINSGSVLLSPTAK
jgi:parallel beta-helix repeat protein